MEVTSSDEKGDVRESDPPRVAVHLIGLHRPFEFARKEGSPEPGPQESGMNLVLESENPQDYLSEIPPVITLNSPRIQAEIERIKSATNLPIERAKLAFETARDKICHSFDTHHPTVTITAEDALTQKEGICFAKAHVLAALLRGLGIPAGFCYQRVLRMPAADSGFALHGLNAVFLEPNGWFRLDPRGNKPGIDSQFSIETEQLAYPIRPELGEVDYPNVFKAPLPAVLEAMRTSKDSQELFFKRPEALAG